ncbi:putative nuclease HARBI1 [Tanacetum coccineum]
MSRRLFLKIVKGISTYEADPLPKRFKFFKVRANCTGRMSLSVIMKCTAAIRQLAYGTTPDAFDEYLQMSKRTARDCILNFNMCIIDLYMSKYLRKPTLEDVEKIYNQHHTRHGFSGMLGSIDCMHWEWKNCPVSWQGQYGSANNDIHVLDNSPLFDDLLDDNAPVAPFVVNDVGFEKGYFKKRQESARKDVERAFGVLQGQDQNMADTDWNEMYANPSRNMQCTWVERCETHRRKAKELRDRKTHISLQQNLMEHIWNEVEHKDEDEDF